MAAVKISNATISIGAGARNDEGRTQYGTFIDFDDGREFEITGLKSGCQGGDIKNGMESLLSFLSAAAESFRYRKCDWNNISEDDNASLFPREITEWAYENSDEISMMEIEISENPDCIEE